MIPEEFQRTAVCRQCKKVFIYDSREVVYRPKMCGDCRAINRKSADKAHTLKRQVDARKLGFDSRRMGLILEPLTVRTHAEVGAILGISAEASRTAERSALAKLRKAFKLDLLSKQLDNSLRSESTTK